MERSRLGLLLLLVGSLTLAEADDAAPQAPAKTSNIIPSAGEVELRNGIGDVKPDGPCIADIKQFCKEVKPGDARLVMCLQRRIQQARQGNIAGRVVSDKCQDAVANFNIDRSKHINKDLLLARACREDVAKHCVSANDSKEPGSVLVCLRAKQKQVSVGCKGEILRAQAEIAADYRMDPRLYDKCHEQVQQLCGEVEPGEGVEVSCLLDNAKAVAWPCLEEVVRVEKEAASDIRLNIKLFKACLVDQKKFCKDVEPGHMRVQECLEDHMDHSDFSSTCKQSLEDVIAQRVADFRLDGGLQEACEQDLQDHCQTTLEEIEKDESKRQRALKCLQQFKEELNAPECRDKVHRQMQRAAKDIRFDEFLAKACQEDRKLHCDDKQPGSARVIRCLQEKAKNLSPNCAAALFDHEVKMAEDIDFKYPMRKACAWEINKFCKDLPNGHARVIRCLQDALEDEDMSPECKAEVMRDQNRMAQDYRLNWRLKTSCDEDIKHLCTGLCDGSSSCGARVLQCLQDRQDNITSPACTEEVFYYQLMEVQDFRNDVILAEACREDVEKYCKDVEPGEGRVHTCLRINRNHISPKCGKEEDKLAALEYRDIRLRPKLAKVCSEERAVFCKDVKPGKARVIKCLMEAMAEPRFGEECRQELKKREDVVKNDYRYDVGVFTNCASSIEQHCAAAKSQLRANATVLKCLVQNFAATDDVCQSEMSRAVRYALWDYSNGQALTADCDDDVDNFCPKGAKARPGGMFTIGAIGRCLSKALLQSNKLNPKCRELVLIAAPKDHRAYLQYPDTTNALIKAASELQRAAGLEGVLVDTYRRDGANVTVTGWVALACIMSLVLVSLGGVVMVYRRVIGADKPHTQYVKSGDA